MAAQGTAGTATEPPPVPPPVSPGPPAVSPPVSPFVPPLECGGDDAQAMGREPLPLLRQILAACAFPELLESPALPEAARDRARRILREMDAGNIGGYNHEHRSHGVPTKISRFLEFRDGIPCDPKNIVLCSGTSTVIPFLLSLFVSPSRSLPPGVLVPVPGPARCSELSVLAGAVPVPVPLDESRGWAWNVPELRRRIRESRSRCEPRVLWVLNPGDPTGHVLSQAQMQELLEVAFEESLLLLADEERVPCRIPGAAERGSRAPGPVPAGPVPAPALRPRADPAGADPGAARRAGSPQQGAGKAPSGSPFSPGLQRPPGAAGSRPRPRDPVPPPGRGSPSVPKVRDPAPSPEPGPGAVPPARPFLLPAAAGASGAGAEPGERLRDGRGQRGRGAVSAAAAAGAGTSPGAPAALPRGIPAGILLNPEFLGILNSKILWEFSGRGSRSSGFGKNSQKNLTRKFPAPYAG
ncbi:translation initiation factor IF-2-like isoform X3 [Catharus ustulatus]|uniref:translation initiation factor IF-2-like isoform X3 n=1 Tax=Catharus ustulatus TaxID=91951 RepID=UPI0014095821|nr:translation initiation factor IF-2-like isoform X3 [Catharus ustulatus]